jgi:small-conductance mechanosensitive channel
MSAHLKTRQWLVVCGLLALIVAGVLGLVLTKADNASQNKQNSTARRTQYVNLNLVQTARSLAAGASTRDEMRLARQALKLADHEVDLAFATALRDAAQQRSLPNPEARALYDRVQKAQGVVKTEQDQVDQLKKQLAVAPPSRQDTIQQRVNLAQAQLELDQDELEDAQEDLMRSGVDAQSRIQRQFTRYQATAQHDQEIAAQGSATKSESDTPLTLIAQINSWQQLRGEANRLKAANKAVSDAATKLRQTHDQLEQELQAQDAARQQLKQQASQQLQASADAEAANSTINSLREFAVKQKSLSDLDKRIQDFQELTDTYDSWIALVQANQLAAIHNVLGSVIWIVLIVLLAYLACQLIDHFLADLTQERKTLRTLRVILRFAVQAIAVLIIVFVLFGLPSQMSTILGLAGAGLTVALKDFIVGFFGWFVLMGKNGIRVGDWVEINGVVGEVIEINWLRTVLLETGNWTDSGHPTGRKVAFVNSFAIEGHFFNFSTSGQWLWDELQLQIPADKDPYTIIEAVQKRVTEETAANAKKAEQEWQHNTSRYRVQSVSAKPAINLRPTGSGVELHLRYITNANERYAMRTHLYQSLVELLHGKQSKEGAPDPTSVAG